MYSFNSRAARVTLGIMLAAFAACADEPTGLDSFPEGELQFTVADPFTVTNANDSGIGSLRWVLSHVTGGETIRFDPSLGGRTIALDSMLRITKGVTIDGPASTGITITTGGKGHVIDAFAPLGVVTLRNVSITGGNGGTTRPGAIFGSTVMVLENSAVYGNQSSSSMINVGIALTLINSTVSGNTSSDPTGWAALSMRNIVLVNSTVANNTGGGVGGADSIVIRNSILANNSAGNCRTGPSVVTREGTNVSDDDTCGGPLQLTIADPKLGPLADNGGPTRTHALLVGSPAINAGTACTVQVDQRHFPRDAQCDAGAFEFGDFTTVALTVGSSPTFDKNGWAVLTGTVRCSRNETFDLYVEMKQLQKNGRETIDVHAVSTTPISCTTNVLPWSVALVTTDEPFQNGDAVATVSTMNAEKWVTPATISQPVKLFRARK